MLLTAERNEGSVPAHRNRQLAESEDNNVFGTNTTTANKAIYRFAIVPKQLSSPFFTVVQEGCLDRARKLGNVECLYEGTTFPDVEGQAQIIRDLASSGEVDGIAVAIAQADAPETHEAIAFARSQDIPIITFDSDAAGSERLTYIGTDNYAFGDALGKVLLQIDPTGGYYGIISTQAPNAIEREKGLRDRLGESNWIEHASSPSDCKESGNIGIENMKEFASHPELKAIIPVGGWPMRNATLWAQFIDQHPHLTTVAADTLPHQMDLLNRGYVTGLVGQVPFQMGVKAMDVLLAHNLGDEIPEEVFGTSLLEVITVPLDRPPAEVDMHYIGNLQYVGFTFAAVVTLLSIGFAVWTYANRNHHVVRASQPSFLIMIAIGAVIMGASTIPMSFDDQNHVLNTTKSCVVACMSSVWLLSIGFTTVFSALFSKTWRINKIFHNPRGFSRIRVEATDVIAPFVLLLSANVLTLSLMTALAPLEFVRKAHAGTDDWNRVISRYGTCQSTTDRWGGAAPYFITLGLINLGVLIVANVQAYQARSIQSEFSESHYIAIAMASMLQTAIIGFPLLFLLQEFPETTYLLKVCMVFVVTVVILVCIFVPKIFSRSYYDKEQRKAKTRISLAARAAHRGSSFASSSAEMQLRRRSTKGESGLRLGWSLFSKVSSNQEKPQGSNKGEANTINWDSDRGLKFVRSSIEEFNELDFRDLEEVEEEPTSDAEQAP